MDTHKKSAPQQHPAPVRSSLPLFVVFLFYLVAWSCAIGGSLWYNLEQSYSRALSAARIQARTAFEKDVIYRRWNSLLGGVYASVTAGTLEPNPYLNPKNREITGPEGRVYTKVNPAYMTRLVHEIGELRSGVRGHITSNNPIRPANAPDPWEKKALEQLESRATEEVADIQPMDGKDYMRLIRGLDTEPSCMPCHEHQGYKVGDVRGGISVSVPMAPFWVTMEDTRHGLYVSHLILWLLGCGGIIVSSRRIGAGIKARDEAEAGLRALTTELEQRVQERTRDLKSRQQELDAFLNNANAGVFLKDMDGRYRMFNERFASIIGKSMDEIRGQRSEDVLDDPAAARRLHDHEHGVISSGTARELKDCFSSQDGSHYSCFSFPVMEEDRAVALGGIVVDMSERDRLEAVLRESKEIAERASRAKSDFLANMSHEIRTPLNGVIGMADLLLRTKLSPDQASMAAAIKTSGDSLLLVLNDVLDISKIEAGKLTLEESPFPIRDVLFDSVKGLTPIAYKKNLELILHISPQVPETVVGDSVRLRQIILNLVNNALKFTERGEVVIMAQVMTISDQSVHLRFSITDTGIGIPADKQSSIFSAFEQVDPSTTRKYGGTGLGLAICSRLLELMNSKLELKSQEGFGSSFWFEVDLPLNAGDVAPPRPILCAQALAGQHVLIVDDNETNLLILKETLASWGMEVRESKSVDEAYALANVAANSNRPFRLVLTDYQMPDKDGEDLLKLFASTPFLAHLPVILLTSGNLRSEMAQGTGKSGFFSAVLDKPVRPESLMRAMAAALNIWESYDVNEIQRSEREHTEPPTDTLSVLLVEDVEMNQMVATRMLKELGHEVTVAADGKEALSLVNQRYFDVVLMDIQMPVMDGIQATMAIRELEQQGFLEKRLTIIAMTANALKGDKDKYLAVGMDGYLAKPILLDDLRRVIKQCLSPEERTGNADDASDSLSHGSKVMPTWCTFLGNGLAGPVKLNQDAETGPQTEETARDADKGAEPSSSAEGHAPSGEVRMVNGQLRKTSSIDWDLLDRSFSGSADFIADSMRLYLRDAPNLFQAVLNAIESGDNSALTVNAHALKGITGYFTRDAAYERCLALEDAGRENFLPGKKAEAQALASELREMMNRLFDDMQDFMSSNAL